MRIRTNLIAPHELRRALDAAGLQGVHLGTVTEHHSRTHAHGFEVYLYADPAKGRRKRNQNVTVNPGEEIGATYDEWGHYIAALFDIDPDAFIGPYRGVVEFCEHHGEKYTGRMAYRDGGPERYPAPGFFREG